MAEGEREDTERVPGQRPLDLRVQPPLNRTAMFAIDTSSRFMNAVANMPTSAAQRLGSAPGELLESISKDASL
jgi:hypothetical protein